MKALRVDFKDLKKAKNPVFSYCRKLIEEGVNGNSTLEIYRGDMLCLRMQVQEGAETSVIEPDRRTGCRPMYFAKYNPWWEKQTKQAV